MQRTICFPAGDSNLPTPLYLIYSKGGIIPNLTTDLLEEILPTPHLIASSFFDIHQNESQIQEFVKKTGKSYKDFICMQKHHFLLDIRDAFRPDQHAKCTESFLYGETSSGVKKIDFPTYFKAIESYGLDYFSALYDVSSIKDKNPGFLTLSKKSAVSCKKSGMIASFVGGKNRLTSERVVEFVGSLDESIKCVSFDQLADSPKESIVVIDNLVLLLEKIHGSLPRVMNRWDDPKLVLEAVSHGIDAFTGKYPFTCAEFGYALVFPLDIVSQDSDIQINLRDMKYEVSPDPILKGCKCYSCRDHTRSYIHHLCNTKEMTGEVLLSIHNLHHYLLFFESIRNHIKNGTFSKYKDSFQKYVY